MAHARYGVAIIGLQPNRSWAAVAHIPALRSMPEMFDIVGVANTSKASAEAAAAACNIPHAYANPAELVADPNVDIVAINVKVPHHLELAKLALNARKHVYCEWPLGNGLAEAREMARMAQEARVLGVCGTQARASPEIVYAAKLIRDGYVGNVLSATIVGRGRGWGDVIPLTATGYVLDRKNGASMLTIPVGHTLAALRDVLGEVDELSAVLANRRTRVKALDTGDMLPMTSHDQVLFSGVMTSGAPISFHFRGGDARDGNGFEWQINGTEGDLQLAGRSGHSQQVPLALRGGRGKEREMKLLEVPASYLEGASENPMVGNVARLYARMAADLRNGTRTAPTFDDAVEVHEIIDAIERSAESGMRLKVG
jgi:predicted dehydrogenase